MTPAARIQAAIEILQGLDETGLPADRYIRGWFASRRYAGSKDRAAVASRVYDVLRHRTSYAWRMGGAAPRALVIASLLSEGANASEVEQLFSAGAYGPAPLVDEERHILAAPQAAPVPSHVQGEYPEWLEPELRRAFGEDLLAEMHALSGRAPVDLRVNTLRAERDDMLTGIRALGFDASPTPWSPRGIRIPSGSSPVYGGGPARLGAPGRGEPLGSASPASAHAARSPNALSRLQQTSFFQTGAVEVQDEAAQIASLLCAARADMRVLDLAAGAGGKALALAAEMQNRGEILATDKDENRLAQLSPRARRAGVTIIHTKVLPPPFTGEVSSEAAEQRRRTEGGAESLGSFDLVLLDAPCSGSGSWRRNPETKDRLTPERLESLTHVQGELLDRAASHVRPGGRLVYATCSILGCENEDQIVAFQARQRGFEAVDAAEVWRDSTQAARPPGMGRFFKASPRLTGTDGFFAAILTRE